MENWTGRSVVLNEEPPKPCSTAPCTAQPQQNLCPEGSLTSVAMTVVGGALADAAPDMRGVFDFLLEGPRPVHRLDDMGLPELRKTGDNSWDVHGTLDGEPPS